MKKHTLVFGILFLQLLVGYSQNAVKKDTSKVIQKENTISSENKFSFKNLFESIKNQPDTDYRKPSIIIGVGSYSFFGDVGDNNIKAIGKSNFGFNFGVEQRLGSIFGTNLNFGFGKFAANDKRNDRNLNFQSNVMNFNLNLVTYFDNNKLLKFLPSSSLFAPFVTLGVGFITFDSKTDILNKDGLKYYYWKDGTIRDQEYKKENVQFNNILVRDYVYETGVDPNNSYSHNSLIIPIGLGVKFKLMHKIDANISTTYYFTTTDNIDGVAEAGFDKFLYANISFQYNIGGQSYKKLYERNIFYKDVNFEAIVNIDSDGDGIADMVDECPETPKGAKVYLNGCPIDDDADGIPNYMDDEILSEKGALVDERGVTMTAKDQRAKYERENRIMNGQIILYKDTIDTYHYDVSQVIPRVKRTTKTLIVPKRKYVKKVVAEETEDIEEKPIVPQIPEIVLKNTPPYTEYVVYRIQILSSNSSEQIDVLKTKFKLKEPIYVEGHGGTYRYYIGNYRTYKEAKTYNERVKKQTKENLFIIAFKAGQRLTLQDALEQTKELSKEVNKEISSDKPINTNTKSDEVGKNGVIFKIQIFASSSNDLTSTIKTQYNIEDDITVMQHGGNYRYYIGYFTTYKKAKLFNDELVKAKGLNTFIIAFKNGSRISLDDAAKLTK